MMKIKSTTLVPLYRSVGQNSRPKGMIDQYLYTTMKFFLLLSLNYPVTPKAARPLREVTKLDVKLLLFSSSCCSGFLTNFLLMVLTALNCPVS